MKSHLVKDLEMSPVSGDVAFYVKRKNGKEISICDSYVDDSLNVEGEEF